MRKQYAVDSMPETGENVAEVFHVSRQDQDAFALRSQQKAVAAQASGRLAKEIVPVIIPKKKGDPIRVDKDAPPARIRLWKRSRGCRRCFARAAR